MVDAEIGPGSPRPHAPPGHGASAVDADPGAVGAGEHDEEEADREVHPIAGNVKKTQKLETTYVQLLRNAEMAGDMSVSSCMLSVCLAVCL